MNSPDSKDKSENNLDEHLAAKSNLSWGDKATQYFFELTPDKILTAAEETGLLCTGRCLQLNSMENRVYEVEVAQDESPSLNKKSPENFRIIKFYRPGRWTKEQIHEEHEFLFNLLEYDIPVVAPIKDSSGESIFEDKELGIYFSIFPKVGGRNPQELDNEQLSIVGRLLARMHSVGLTKESKHRIVLSPETYGYGSLDFLLESRSLPESIEAEYEDLVTEISELSFPLFREVDYQRVHGDCHLGNLLWGEKGPFWVDFDDMVFAPAVQDIWLIVQGRDEQALLQRQTLISAYQEMKEFDLKEIKLIEPLRTLRVVHFNAWIAKRWEDPFFPKAFPTFGTDTYWREQLVFLREQLEIVEKDFT